jgi:hypothetical protein
MGEHTGTRGENKKSLSPYLLKKKKTGQFMLSLPIGCMKFLFPKLFITIFGLG